MSINVWGNPSEKFAKQLVNWYRNHDIKEPISIFVGQRNPWNFNTIGWAMYDSACDTRTGRQFNTNLLNGIADKKAAEIFAHELGHNLGMRHDFDERHGGNGQSQWSSNWCNGKGLMSYGSNLKGWSSCSNEDFKNWYLRSGWRCLESSAIW